MLVWRVVGFAMLNLYSTSIRHLLYPQTRSGRRCLRSRPYENEVVKRWTAEIARSDGFIIEPENVRKGRRGPGVHSSQALERLLLRRQPLRAAAP